VNLFQLGIGRRSLGRVGHHVEGVVTRSGQGTQRRPADPTESTGGNHQATERAMTQRIMARALSGVFLQPLLLHERLVAGLIGIAVIPCQRLLSGFDERIGSAHRQIGTPGKSIRTVNFPLVSDLTAGGAPNFELHLALHRILGIDLDAHSGVTGIGKNTYLHPSPRDNERGIAKPESLLEIEATGQRIWGQPHPQPAQLEQTAGLVKRIRAGNEKNQVAVALAPCIDSHLPIPERHRTMTILAG
jgi:hypothetical protein